MQRKSISASEYTAILGELVITGTHANVMAVTVGTHAVYGRVVLMASGSSFVLIADRLDVLRESFDENHVMKAVAEWAESADEAGS